MKKILQAIISFTAVIIFMSGCELMDAGGKKMLPFGDPDIPINDDAALKSMSVQDFAISPDFDPSTLEYSLYVAKSTTPSLTVQAIGPDGATVTAAINGGAPIAITAPGYSATMILNDTLTENDIEITVVSEDTLTTTVYMLRVYYLSSDAGLASLSVSAGDGLIKTAFSPAFIVGEASGTVHTVTLNYWATEIKVNLALQSPVMKAMVDGWSAENYEFAVPISDLPPTTGTIAQRTRDITVAVTSQDKSTTVHYIIRVTMDVAPSNEARLNSLVFSYQYLVWYNDVSLLPNATAENLLTVFNYAVSQTWVIASINCKFEVKPITTVTGIAGRYQIVGGSSGTFTFSGPDANGVYTGQCASGGDGKTTYYYIDITAGDGSTVKTYWITVRT
ncbi:MAG TPA: cadherin-like beta sandwich domain-containing protein [Spirochaetota bacterium]|nr:cadherin-like beta sandwich domain-containing protein [Spirochaetota bacterium]HOD15619.1 cadherin-like beta sandwich domain-containing protein [Spirochaetota bacterium]HPG49983.1 cadherin-like beta sandwich domain-containing protein [Spirochaetota bacterium]HPN13621.1 cadherin-like beta sandwich domain-containing protein [Spirochaetota bacterium]